MPWNTLTLPPYEDYYIVTCKGAKRTMTLYYLTEYESNFRKGKWVDDKGQEYEVIAWMPMPKAYGTPDL